MEDWENSDVFRINTTFDKLLKTWIMWRTYWIFHLSLNVVEIVNIPFQRGRPKFLDGY